MADPTNVQKLEFFDRLWNASSQPVIAYQFPLQRPMPIPLPHPGDFLVFEVMVLPGVGRIALAPIWEMKDVRIDMLLEEAERCVVAVTIDNGLRRHNAAELLMQGRTKFPQPEAIFRWRVTVGRPVQV